MKLIVSGYGFEKGDTIALFDGSKRLWGDSIPVPSFIATEQDGKYMYTITESDSGIAYAYKYSDGGYLMTDKTEIDGSVLCHIAFSEKNRLLFGACYGSGNFFAVKIQDGKFGKIMNIREDVPEGYAKETVSRTHCVLLNKKENILAITNITLDRISFYDIMPDKISLRRELPVKRGAGPRHIIYSGDESRMYLITEYSNEMMTFDCTDDYKMISCVPTLPDDFTGTSACSTLCLSHDERFLYGANRFADTIVRYDINEHGIPYNPMWFDCGGKNPRHMCLSDNGKQLVVLNQDSDSVMTFELDGKSGMPFSSKQLVSFGGPGGVAVVAV